MKISYNWLKTYIDFNMSPDELSKVLTDIGLEVEGIEEVEGVRGGLKGVVVGEVLSCDKHPNADKLKITEVSIGETTLPIVCGAPNVDVGQKVLVATVGSTIYPIGHDGLKIKKSKIRGSVSEGMICAEDELGLGTSHDGIMVLDNNAVVGIAASEFLKLQSDYTIEIGLTPNRADAMGHLGVARDLKAYLQYRGVQASVIKPPVLEIPQSSSPVEVVVEDKQGCPKYIGVVLRNVKIDASPEWLRNRLNAIGIAPINNIVDITNYVLHETGQPLHAFDAEIVSGKVIVKRAAKGETFKTLDGEDRTLDAEDLMICNSDTSMCLAGVFGGADSGVSDNTVDVFLESAWFDPVSVRKTAKRHGLNTDASFRFERGVDPHITEYAIKRAALLIQDIAGGVPDGGLSVFNEGSFEDFAVEFNPEAARKLIGDTGIEDEDFRKVFTALEMEVKPGGSSWMISVPPYRVDVQRQADLIEEFLRIYGLNEVPIPEKVHAAVNSAPEKDGHKLFNSVATILSANGFSEIMNNSLISNDANQTISGDKEAPVSLLNPLSNELTEMRKSLVSGMLTTVHYNQNRQNPDLKLYELGNVYVRHDEIEESRQLGIVITGAAHAENWSEKQQEVSFYSLKTTVSQILDGLGLKYVYGKLSDPALEDGLGYYLGKNHLGELGWIKSDILKKYGIKNKVFYAVLNWDVLVKLYKPGIRYTEVSKFPEVRRDLSLLIESGTTFNEIREVSMAAEKKILKSVNLFDVYEGDKIDSGKKVLCSLL